MSEYADSEPDPEPDLETVPPAPTVPGPRPPDGRGPVVAFLSAIVVVALIVGFATSTLVLDARDSDPTAASATPGSSAPTPTFVIPRTPAPTVPAGPVDPDDGVLAGLIVKQTQVSATATVHHLPHGADLTIGTLDLCNGKFASEAKRTARRQVTLSDAQDNVSLSTEAVLYPSPAVGSEAVAEVRSVVQNCPKNPVVSPIGEPTVTTTFGPAPDGAWPRTPTVERLAYDFLTVPANAADQTHSIAVYLRRGRVLMGLYFPSPGSPQVSVAGRTTIPGIVGFFQDRMAALPARVVNR